MRYKIYKTELVNGIKGEICIPESMDFKQLIHNRKFIDDGFNNHSIKSDSIVMFEYIGVKDLHG